MSILNLLNENSIIAINNNKQTVISGEYWEKELGKKAVIDDIKLCPDGDCSTEYHSIVSRRFST
jgi:hypothetical protein